MEQCINRGVRGKVFAPQKKKRSLALNLEYLRAFFDLPSGELRPYIAEFYDSECGISSIPVVLAEKKGSFVNLATGLVQTSENNETIFSAAAVLYEDGLFSFFAPRTVGVQISADELVARYGKQIICCAP